jgi:hypothetical protein
MDGDIDWVNARRHKPWPAMTAKSLNLEIFEKCRNLSERIAPAVRDPDDVAGAGSIGA